jgi:hypothetical protein
MSVPIVQAAALDVVLPTMLDSAAIVDQSDASQMKLALLTEQHMLFSRNFAEIRSADTDISGVVVLNTSTYVGPIPFTSNVSLSAAVAGDPDAGTVLTADQANDKIVIPPKTAVFVEFSIVVVSIAGTDNVVVTPTPRCDGSDSGDGHGCDRADDGRRCDSARRARLRLRGKHIGIRGRPDTQGENLGHGPERRLLAGLPPFPVGMDAAVTELVVTPGAADADAYVSTAEADTFLLAARVNLSRAWADAVYPDKLRAIRWATVLMDAAFEWEGSPSDPAQRLRFPRAGLVTQDGYAVLSTTIPEQVARATAELAAYLLTQDRTTHSALEVAGLSELKVGSISLKADRITSVQALVPPYVALLVMQFGRRVGMATGGRGGSREVLRS